MKLSRTQIETLKSLYNHTYPEPLGGIIIVIVSLFSFGVLLGGLGYFQDDWHHVFYYYHEEIDGLARFFMTDNRPFATWVYSFLFNVLGVSPASWHWQLMVVRLCTTLVFWLLCRQIWPTEKLTTLWLGIFFAVHPVFTLQALSVAYSLHWASYLISMISFLFMAMALRKPEKRNLYVFISLVTQLAHLVLIEYFAGLEIFRVFIIWLLLKDTLEPITRIQKTIKVWLPFLFVLALYAAYRLSFNQIYGFERFEFALINLFIDSPLNGLIRLIQISIQDLIYVSITPWYTALNPANFEMNRPSTWIMIASAAGTAIGISFLISRIRFNEPEKRASKTPITLLMFGGLAILLALFPTWLPGFSIYEKNPLWSSRFAIPAMVGASMALVGVATLFIENRLRRNIFLSILLGISVGFHIHTARNFNQSWEKQVQLYWQLWWRMPSLETGTLIAADSEILPFMGDTPTAYAINLIYAKTTLPGSADYWFTPGYSQINIDTFFNGEPANITKYSTTFSAHSNKVLAITFEPQSQQCMWVMRPEYRELPDLPETAYRWMAYSNLSLIHNQPIHTPPAEIFGNEPAHLWCYYYQKADLALQTNDWNKIKFLWEEASSSGLRPANGVELLPFIQAYAYLNEWQQAYDLTIRASVLPPRTRSLLCFTWETIASRTDDTLDKNEVIRQVKNRLSCQN